MKRAILMFAVLFIGFSLPVKSQINTDRVLTIGKNALYFEDYILSIQYFNQVIKAKPYLADPYLYRALAKFNLDDYTGAEADLTLCIERNPFLWYAYQCRGAARQNLGNHKGAIEDYIKGLEFRPEDKQMLINMAIAHVQLEEFDPAISTLNLLLKQQPKYTQAYLTRGLVYVERGDTLLAFDDYNKAIELDKHYAPSYGRRGMLFLQQEKYTDALNDLNEAIRLEPKQIVYYINRGLTRYYQNDLKGAMSDYDVVVNQEPQNIIARFNRGLLKSNVGDTYGAIDDFGEVIKLEPDNFIALYNRAILNTDAHNYREAIADLNKVLEEYPNFVPGYYFRSDVKRKLNDAKGADKDYWYAYDLEQNLRKQQAQGKTITGKEVVDSDQTTENDNSRTREKSDKSIEKFNRLVVYDKEEENSTKYKNEIRGRIQDKQVKVDLKPQFVITYYEQVGSVENSNLRFDKMISDYNSKNNLKLQLRVVSNEAPLTDEQADHHFQSIDEYSLLLDRNSADINASFGRALDYMVLMDLSEAFDDFSQVINLDSTFAMAYFNRAIVRYKQMEISNLSRDENEGLSFNLSTSPKTTPTLPGHSPYTQSAIVTTPNKEIEETKRSFDYDLILSDYEAVIKLNPDFVFAYFNRGNIRCLQKNFRVALVDYNEAIERNPDFAEAYFNRGLTRLYLGDTERGIIDLSKAGELGIIDAYNIIKKMTAD